MAAIELIAEEPVRFVTERVTHCDGGKLFKGVVGIYLLNVFIFIRRWIFRSPQDFY